MSLDLVNLPLIIAIFSKVGTLSRSGHIKIFILGWCTCIFPPFTDEVLSDEIVKKDNEKGGNISGKNFLGGNFRGGDGGGRGLKGEVWWVEIFLRGIFLEPG